jgi:hypothetical protein
MATPMPAGRTILLNRLEHIGLLALRNRVGVYHGRAGPGRGEDPNDFVALQVVGGQGYGRFCQSNRDRPPGSAASSLAWTM